MKNITSTVLIAISAFLVGLVAIGTALEKQPNYQAASYYILLAIAFAIHTYVQHRILP